MNFDTPVESQGINMILAGRVSALEKELEDRKRMDAINSDTAQRAYRLGADSQNMLVDVMKQRDKLYGALSVLRAMFDTNGENWSNAREYAKKTADEALHGAKVSE
jgi:hypothetical protein